MSIFEEIIGEIFVQTIWSKIIKPFFVLSGAGLRLLFNFNKTPRQTILDKDNNGVIGFLFWALAVTTIIIALK